MTQKANREWASVGLVAMLVAAVRLAWLDQPIVENYIGRQIPTAMVARNLSRGSGFLFPQLDTGPFPALFLVEPPIYQAAVVALARPAHLGLEPAGRLVSALGIVLASLSLYGLVRRRECHAAALASMAALGAFPVTLRYGRAFQPDALALGLALLGALLWDRWRTRGGRLWADLAWAAVALALAVKLLWAFSLLPIGWLIRERLNEAMPGRPTWHRHLALALILGSMLVPAGLWYVHASACLASQARASSVNASVWLEVVGPGALLRRETWPWIWRLGIVRAFTPPALALAIVAVFARPGLRWWRAWLLGAVATLACVAAKLHHEYYWLLAAPAVAAGAGGGVVALFRMSHRFSARAATSLLCLGMLGLCYYEARSTWTVPGEWTAFHERGHRLAEHVGPTELVIAREGVLYAMDRRGMRMEHQPTATLRALREWGQAHPVQPVTPDSLVAWYHDQGARYYAEMSDPAGPIPQFPGPAHLVERTLIQEPGLLLVRLIDKVQGEPDAHDSPADRSP